MPLSGPAGGPEVDALWVRNVAMMDGPGTAEVQGALSAVGLPPDFPRAPPTRIRLRQEVDFFERMAELTGDGLYGVHAGLRWVPKGTNLNSYILFASSTLREALETIVRFVPLDHPAPDYDFAERGDGSARIVMGSRDRHEREQAQSTEFQAAMVLTYIGAAVGEKVPALKIGFAHRRAANRREVADAFGCPVRFGERITSLSFPAAALDLPIPTQDDALCRSLREHGERLMRERRDQRSDFARRLERLVLDDLPLGGLGMAEAAREMGMSERTLARRMAESGVSLRGMRDDLRREMAVRYLGEGRCSVQQTAYLTGYADASAFSAAFRRWTGSPPGRFRDAAIAGGGA